MFHAISSFLIYLIVEFIAENMPSQAGYAYLASVFLKMGVFILLYKSVIFSDMDISKAEKVSLVIPLFLFLILEAIFCSKLLNKK